MAGRFLQFDDGYLYGQVRGDIVKINPDTLEHEVLAEDTKLFAMDPDGNIYFARGTKLYQYDR